MKVDGSVIIDTKIIDGGMEKGFEAIKSEMNTVGMTAEKVGDKLRVAFSGKVSAPIENAFAKVEQLGKKLDVATEGFYSAVYSDDDKGAEKWASRRDAIYDQLENARRKLSQVIVREADKEAKAEKRAAQKALKEKERAYKNATKSARAFGKRLTSIMASALVFNVISKGLREITQYFGNALKSNKKFSDSWNTLKGAVLTAVQPIYEVLLPGLIMAINVAAKLARMIGSVFATLSGKSAEKIKENAKALYEQANATEKTGKAAEKAKKQLAGFDELNVLGRDAATTKETDEADSNTAKFEFQDIDINSKLSEMATLAAEAIFALGIILVLSGANIPLGLGMIVFGGLLLYKSIEENWGSVESSVVTTAEAIAFLSSAVLLAIGIILTFCCPTHLGLGIGLIIAGVSGMGIFVATNWNAIKETLQTPLGATVALIAGAVFIVLGILCCFAGVWALGIGCIIAGAAAIVTTVAVNWNAIVTKVKETVGGINDWIQAHGFAMMILGIVLLFTGFAIPIGLALIGQGVKGMVAGKDPLWNIMLDKIKECWQGIKTFWNNHVAKVFTGQFWSELAKKAGNGLISGFEGYINSIISMFESMINWIVKGLNKISFDVPDWVPGIGGKKFGFNIPEAKFGRVSIPRLAQGAVLPPNRPFLSVVGDQRHGTNIEAPLETIQEAVAAVMADYEAANLAGHEATVETLRQILSAVLGIEIGDTTIGQAANRYNQKMAIIKGGF